MLCHIYFVRAVSLCMPVSLMPGQIFIHVNMIYPFIIGELGLSGNFFFSCCYIHAAKQKTLTVLSLVNSVRTPSRHGNFHDHALLSNRCLCIIFVSCMLQNHYPCIIPDPPWVHINVFLRDKSESSSLCVRYISDLLNWSFFMNLIASNKNISKSLNSCMVVYSDNILSHVIHACTFFLFSFTSLSRLFQLI